MLAVQAQVNAGTATPLIATAITGVTSGACAALIDLEALADLVSIGALTVFYLVAVACLWRRYVARGQRPRLRVLLSILALLALSTALSGLFAAQAPTFAVLACAGARLRPSAQRVTSTAIRALGPQTVLDPDQISSFLALFVPVQTGQSDP